jgi:hypothetical protein
MNPYVRTALFAAGGFVLFFAGMCFGNLLEKVQCDKEVLQHYHLLTP